jgi:hypothetical protein
MPRVPKRIPPWWNQLVQYAEEEKDVPSKVRKTTHAWNRFIREDWETFREKNMPEEKAAPARPKATPQEKAVKNIQKVMKDTEEDQEVQRMVMDQLPLIHSIRLQLEEILEDEAIPSATKEAIQTCLQQLGHKMEEEEEEEEAEVEDQEEEEEEANE